MTDPKTGQESLAATINADWSIFGQLAGLDEPQRRRILRSHHEKGFTQDDLREMALRDVLDSALSRMLLLELAAEIGFLPFALPASAESFTRLLDSSAFVRYLDTYLYFGIRFLAGRAQPATLARFPHGEDSDINELPVALPAPPPIASRDAAGIEVRMPRFLQSLRAESDDDVQTALKFLDGFAESGEQAQFELWLRGLVDGGARQDRFARITRGFVKFASAKTAFYKELEGDAGLKRWREEGRIKGGWCASQPLTARFGTNELYWLARLLRVEIAPTGLVSGTQASWLTLIADSGWRGEESVETIQEQDEVLHGVLDYVCDLIQNAVAISRERLDRVKTPEAFAPPVAGTVGWRTTYDEELDEIVRQRSERRFDKAARDASWTGDQDHDSTGWSRRVRTGDQIGNLVGLAFSGGGIRSATFNLGVLQRLQELDLLRHVDYLSTVSGGGYIGAWLLGNVHRTPYWLTPLTDWSAAVGHLRRFSNYLAPRTGLMSADTWSMWLSWIRNAALIQLSAAIWVSALLVIARLVKFVFDASAFTWLGKFPANLVLAGVVAILTAFVYRSLRSQMASISASAIHWGAVLPVWFASFITSAMLWASRAPRPAVLDEAYSEILWTRWEGWLVPLASLFLGFGIVSWCSIGAHEGGAPEDESLGRDLVRAIAATAVAAAALAVVYLGLCGVQWTFEHVPYRYDVWFAYVFGGPLVVFVMGIAIIIIIGLIGPDSPDWRREWWTRFGAWLGIYGVGFLALTLTSVFAPALIVWGLSHDRSSSIAWGTVLGWIATVAGGLFAGNSEKTNGQERESAMARAIGWVSKIAAFLFIVGALILVATGLHALLVKVWTTAALLDYWQSMDELSVGHYAVSLVVLIALGAIMSWRFEINIFGLNQFYRNRLIRCYLGGTRWRPGMRKPHEVTGFDYRDDLPLWRLRRDPTPPGHTPFRGPFPIINCSLNLGGSSDLAVHTRHSASFVLTPLRCGADRRQVGYAPTSQPRAKYANGVFLGQAISVSGAAASPNMGYSTSPLVAVLLTMFNVRLAWWFPNPGRSASIPFVSLYYLVKELFGIADEKGHYINVSDGGHFENLGIYELIRRRCKVIIACDAECDSSLSFGSLGNVVRICETDFGARIDIDVRSIERDNDSRHSRSHCTVGRITYANGSQGYLVYLKSSVTGDEDVGIAQYRAAHPAFPHEPTSDQFFAEDQFESYRRLGHHIAAQAFRSVETDEKNLVTMAGKLAEMWAPEGLATEFVSQAKEYSAMMERLGTDPKLHALFRELMLGTPADGQVEVTNEERAACLELLQLMENAYLALRLDEFWTHPDNRGWVILFSKWARSRKFRVVWDDSHTIYGMRFAYFCHERLGLPIDSNARRT